MQSECDCWWNHSQNEFICSRTYSSFITLARVRSDIKSLALSWTLQNDQQGTVTFCFRPCLLSNDIIPIHQAVIAGLGIGLLPKFLFCLEPKRHKVTNILPQWSSLPVQINAIYPSRKYALQKVKVFLEFLEQNIGKIESDRPRSPLTQ